MEWLWPARLREALATQYSPQGRTTPTSQGHSLNLLEIYMTVHQVPTGTMTGNAPAEPIKPKTEPVLTYGPINLEELISSIPEPKVKQFVASTIYNNCGARIAYQALGMVATMQSNIVKQAVEEQREMTLADALDYIKMETHLDDNIRIMQNEEQGASKVKLIAALMRTREDMFVLIKGMWHEFKGRTLAEELARTYEVRAVRPDVVDEAYDYLEGENTREDISAALTADAVSDAQAARDRNYAANMLLTLIEPAPEGTDLPEVDELRLLNTLDGALKRQGLRVLVGKAGGFASGLDRLGTVAVIKGLRKDVARMMLHPRFHREDAHEPVEPSDTRVDLTSFAKQQERLLSAQKDD